ncbi:MAG: sulfate permease, partial [Methylococcaceae bacterium]
MDVKSLEKFIPLLQWLPEYQSKDLSGDIIAGTIVTIVLIPQAMAYAMLAGLPPQFGLYSCIAPIVLYSVLGTSRTLAVGPVGLMSLMTATALSSLNLPESQLKLAALTLALLVGIILILMRIIRLGAFINFLSHPVISGFTSAGALLIAFSQLKHLLGLPVPSGLAWHKGLIYMATNLEEINWITAALGIGGILLLLGIRSGIPKILTRLGTPATLVNILSKSGPLLVVIVGTLLSRIFDLRSHAGVSIVGAIPAGLPAIAVPYFDWTLWQMLLQSAALIAVIGFLESVSVAKALASRRRQKINPNQELLALGAANIGAAFSGGYTVAGGFGRSMINFTSGANTPLASLITAVLVAFSLLFLTPLFYYLPHAVLAAIIMLAVFALIDVDSIRHTWTYNKADTAALITTFIAVLIIGLEPGILFGAGLSIALYLHQSSRPHLAIVGRVGESEHFRNVDRHPVTTYPDILALRIDENLYFANTHYLEDKILELVVDNKEV